MSPSPAPGSPSWMRPLGGTGIAVSAVCFGASPIGNLPRLYGHEVTTDMGVATVRTVLDSPIRTLDTSNGYGDGESERRIGQAIAAAGGLAPDAVVITKVDPRGRDYSGDRVRTSLDESRDRLGLDTLPLVHLHDPESFDFTEMSAPGGPVDTLVRLKESGAIGSIGLAGGRVQEIAKYLAMGVFDVLLVHNRWTLLDRSAGDLIEDAVARGMGVLNAAVYGGGYLASPGTKPATYGYREARPEILDAVAAMQRVCADHGTDIRTAALQFSLRDDRFGSTVVGMSRPERVQDTLDAAAQVLPDGIWAELEALLPPREVWLDAPFD